MISLRKQAFMFVLFILVYGSYVLTHSLFHQPSRVLGTSVNVALYEEPQDGRAPLIAAVNSARKEVLVEVYLLSDSSFINALENAQLRGVQVKVMLKQHPFGSGNLNTKTQKALQNSHVAVSWANPAFALTHEKSVVIDNSEVFILSQNLTASAFTKNREYDVLDADPTDVTEVRNIFIADWERHAYAPTDPNLVVSPSTSRDMLTSLIKNATRSIFIEMEEINDPMLIQLLGEKAKIIPVEIIMPTFSQMSANASPAITLQKMGVQVKTLASPYMHAKLFVVDGQKAYVGSINLSPQSMDDNRELGIVLTQQDVITKLVTSFDSDWGRATAQNN